MGIRNPVSKELYEKTPGSRIRTEVEIGVSTCFALDPNDRENCEECD